jgi:predicted MFS family arabinose efflux permease
VRAEIAEGIRFLARDPYLRPISIYATTSNLAYAGSAALVVVFLVRIAGFGPAAVGLLMAAAGTGGFLGALVARRLAGRFGTARVLLVSSLGGGLFELLIPLTGTGARAACYVFGAGISAATILIGNIIVGSFRQAYAPPAMLGRVTAAGRFLGFGGIPFGALAAGGLGTAIGVRNALWVMLGIDALTATFLLTRAIRSNENLPARHAA